MDKRKLFGTDGIRGKSNAYPLDSQTVVKIGQACAVRIKNGSSKPLFVIGRDTRRSGYIIEAAFVSGLCSMGADAVLLGVVPTPAVAMLTKSLGANAGVVITASHNPAEDNGIKLFSEKGIKLPDQIELEIEKLIFENNFDTKSITAEMAGTVQVCDETTSKYLDFVRNMLDGSNLSGLKIVLDCANGAACYLAQDIFEKLGANVTTIHNQPNGININSACGAMHPENLAHEVIKTGADIGMAFDGDADRLIVVDQLGNIIDGDAVMYLLAIDHNNNGKLAKQTLVVTDYSNLALDFKLKEKGIQTVRVENGDRYVIQEMLREGYSVGGEKSGHIILGNYNTTGDGIVSAVYLASILKKSGKELSKLISELKLFPQVLDNIEVCEKKPLEQIPEYSRLKKQIEQDLGSEGRLFVRYSGTQNLCRVMLEGKDLDTINSYKTQVVDVINAAVGATFEQKVSAV